MPRLFTAAILFSLTGCSYADRSALSAWGKPHDIKCYSGVALIYSGTSAGKVENEAHSDGYYFRDAKTGRFVTVSANCIIEVEP